MQQRATQMRQIAPPSSGDGGGTPPPVYMSAIGGTIVQLGDYRLHIISEDEDFIVEVAGEAEVLQVGGAGGGGVEVGAGGGAGGLRHFHEGGEYGPVYFEVGTYPVVMGRGGAGSTTPGVAGADGTGLDFNGLNVPGGGGGASWDSMPGRDGASGGGGYGYSNPQLPGNGIAGFGNRGGNPGSPSGFNLSSSGGGGFSGPGQDGQQGVAEAGHAEGGPGYVCDITGAPMEYAKGGRGSGAAWLGATDPTPHTGNGGDGNSSGQGPGKTGADGVLMIKYLSPVL